jgi:adenylate kinase
MPLIILLGPPGVGKGTQAARIRQHLGVPSMSTGDLLRQARQSGSSLGQRVASYLDQGQLVPDDVIIEVVAAELAKPQYGRGCLLDGFPRTVPQAEALDEYLQDKPQRIDLVLQLEAPQDELVRRILQRAEIEGRTDDTPDVVRQRMEVYQQSTEPLVEYYRQRQLLEPIDGLGTPEEVAGRIRQCLDRHFPGPTA